MQLLQTSELLDLLKGKKLISIKVTMAAKNVQVVQLGQTSVPF